MLIERAGLRGAMAADGDPATLAEPTPEVRALMKRIEPMCEVLYLVMVADDETDANETDSIRGAIATLTSGGLSEQRVDSMLRRYAAASEVQGRQERLMQVATQLSADGEDAETALALAAAVAIADGTVASAEEKLLTQFSEWLGISSRRAAVVLDTVG
jgi:tellurite resistance protein